MTNNRITLIWDWSSSRLADFLYWQYMSVVGNYKLSVSRGSPQGSNVAFHPHYGCIFWGQNNKVGLSKSTCPSGIPGYEGGIPKLPEPEPLAGRLRKLQCRSCFTDFLSASSRVILWLSVAGRGKTTCMSGPQETWKFALRVVFLFQTWYCWCATWWFQPFHSLSACPPCTCLHMSNSDLGSICLCFS